MAQNDEWDVVVAGGINSDFLIRGKTLPAAGQTIEGDVFYQGSGGKGANQAVALARLGARVALIGRVGRDERGTMILKALAEEGVDTRYVIRDEGAPTGVALIMVEHSGEKQIMTAPGATLHVSPGDILNAEAVIRVARVLLTQLELPPAAVEEALRLAHSRGVRTVVDPAPARPLESSLLRNVDVIRPNSSEAEILTGIRVTGRASARSAAALLLREGVQAVAVQAGEDGDLLVWRGGEHWLPRIPVERVDATGAGDAFAAGIAFGLARQKSLVDAAKIANAAAALATTKVGAQAGLPKWPEVERLLADPRFYPQADK